MRSRHSACVEYVMLEQRVRALGASVSDRLNDEQRRWLDEFLDAGEYGLALEMVADWLSEAGRRITPIERAEAKTLAEAMGNLDRVMGPLSLCPD
jgi:hypothetical protein